MAGASKPRDSPVVSTFFCYARLLLRIYSLVDKLHLGLCAFTLVYILTNTTASLVQRTIPKPLLRIISEQKITSK
jgi:Na+-translocating ferredoxin:NAD+ oxidoreductase RnfE subunit